MSELGSIGETVTSKFTREYWQKRYSEENEIDEYRNASWQIGNILDWVGKWSFKAKILDVQCAGGAMVHLLRDNGFLNSFGVDDAAEVSVYWEDIDGFDVASPTDLPHEDESQDFVTWFSATDGRIPFAMWDEVVSEMNRVSRKYIMGKFVHKYDKKKHEEVLGMLLNQGLITLKTNPVLGYYILGKG